MFSSDTNDFLARVAALNYQVHDCIESSPHRGTFHYPERVEVACALYVGNQLH